MKKLLRLVFLILLLIPPIYSQEFEVHLTDSIAYSQPGNFFIVEGHIKNLSTAHALTIKMVRLQNNLPDTTWTSSLCFGACVPSWIDSIAWTIPPDTSELFSVDFFSGLNPGTASVLIKFATLSNSQVETQWFIGSTMPNGIQDVTPHFSQKFKLFNNYPNPFNNQTIISANIDKPAKVNLQIFDILGREVYTANREISSIGQINFRWNGINNSGEELSSGIYFYRISAQSTGNIHQSEIKKLTLLR